MVTGLMTGPDTPEQLAAALGRKIENGETAGHLSSTVALAAEYGAAKARRSPATC